MSTTHPHPPATIPAKVAVIAEVLDLGVDHDIDLAALISDLEADGYTITADTAPAVVDEILSRVAAYSTTPIVY